MVVYKAIFIGAIFLVTTVIWWAVNESGESGISTRPTQPQGSRDPTADNDRRTDKELARRLARFEARVTQLERQQAAQPADEERKVVDDSSEPSDAHDVEARDFQLQRDPAEQRAIIRTRLAWLDEALDDEHTDSSWAGDTEAVLTAAFEQGRFEGSSVRDIHCKTSFCRVEVEHNDNIAGMKFEHFARAQPMSYYLQPIEDEDGTRTTTVLYTARQGYENKEHPMVAVWRTEPVD